MWVLSYSRTHRGRGKRSATHIKHNLLDLIKMNNIKSQNGKTHEVLMYGSKYVIWTLVHANLWLAHKQ